MRVLGKFMGGHNGKNFAKDGYAVLDVSWVHVAICTDSAVGEDHQYYLRLGTTYVMTSIKQRDGKCMSFETANTLVKDIASEEMLDLDEYNMGFYNVWNTLPESICITNEVDEDLNIIPLMVEHLY